MKKHLVITGTSPPPIFFPVKAGLRKSVKKSARPIGGSRTHNRHTALAQMQYRTSIYAINRFRIFDVSFERCLLSKVRVQETSIETNSTHPTVGYRTPLSPDASPWHFRLCYRRHRCNDGLLRDLRKLSNFKSCRLSRTTHISLVNELCNLPISRLLPTVAKPLKPLPDS